MPTDTIKLAQTIRGHALRMITKAKASHVGSCLSMADLLAVLYGSHLRIDPHRPDWPERDRLIVSKGHGAAILYAVLAERGFFPVADLMTYSQDGSPLTGHVSHHVPASNYRGFLGHGCRWVVVWRSPGNANTQANETFVIVSDGELDEGSNWEASSSRASQARFADGPCRLQQDSKFRSVMKCSTWSRSRINGAAGLSSRSMATSCAINRPWTPITPVNRR